MAGVNPLRLGRGDPLEPAAMALRRSFHHPLPRFGLVAQHFPPRCRRCRAAWAVDRSRPKAQSMTAGRIGEGILSAERVERRLAAILAADVAGYSRLMGRDEAGTLARLNALRRELIDLQVADHKGRIVKTTGDGLLIEFPSVVEAVACALAVQQGMTERNAT